MHLQKGGPNETLKFSPKLSFFVFTCLTSLVSSPAYLIYKIKYLYLLLFSVAERKEEIKNLEFRRRAASRKAFFHENRNFSDEHYTIGLYHNMNYT